MREETKLFVFQLLEDFKIFYERGFEDGYGEEFRVEQCQIAIEELKKYISLETIFPRS